MKLFTFFRTRTKAAIISIVCVVALCVALGVTLAFVLRSKHKGVVVTNGQDCSRIGGDIMKKGGNAVDAAIAALFCEGVSIPESMGLGGGFLMTIYNRSTGEVCSLNARETAPAAATKDMFHGNSNLSLDGGLAVAVPAELRGYWTAYHKFGGGVPWKDLVEPTINLCENGIIITSYLESILKSSKEILMADPILRDVFIDPKTNEPYVKGEFYKLPKLAKTLKIIATEGGNALHNGSLTKGFVEDIQNHGGIISEKDMNDYKPVWQNPINTTLSGGLTLWSAPIPGSGVILSFILNLLDGHLDTSNPFCTTNYQRIVESFKFAYARRSDLGDRDWPNITQLIGNLTSKEYANSIRQLISDITTHDNIIYYGAHSATVEDHGTAHVAVLSPSGDAVSVTSTINYVFGAKFVSSSTGIILNDQMDDFSSPSVINVYGVPPSPSNFIIPGKRPTSSMSPTIIVDGNGDVLMAVGGAGGTKIITEITQVIINHLWFDLDLNEASGRKRIHHQLLPMVLQMESDFEKEDINLIKNLRAVGHNISFWEPFGFEALTALSTNHMKSIVGVSDKRRHGSVTYL